MSDTLSNLLSHIKTAQNNRILMIQTQESKLALAVLNILQDNGYIRGFRFPYSYPNAQHQNILSRTNFLGQDVFIARHIRKNPKESGATRERTNECIRKIQVLLQYKNHKPAISNIIRISKPSKRIYVSRNQLAKAILSSSSYFSHNKQAIKHLKHGKKDTNTNTTKTNKTKRKEGKGILKEHVEKVEEGI